MPHPRLRLTLLALLLLLLAPARASAQDALEDAADLMKETVQRIIVPKSALTNSLQVRSAFRDVVADSRRWTCRVVSGGRDAALGTIVESDGWIVTKASQLKGDVVCRLSTGREYSAKLVGQDETCDLALLKIDAQNLPAVAWAEPSNVQVGQWAVTSGAEREPVAVGVVSVLSREIPKPSGILGVILEEGDAGPTIVHVLPDSGAAHAGLQVGDVVTHCNQQATKQRQTLIETVRKFSPGDEVRLTIRREGAELQIAAKLTSGPTNHQAQRKDVQNSMGSELSRRRNGFPRALQHDAVIRPTDCGGPLVNLDGQALGVNVARAGRTESFAIPAAEVQAVVKKLKK